MNVQSSPRAVAVVGAGWAGLSAAIAATRAGAQVTVFEASRTLGGRARSVTVGSRASTRDPPGTLDNGQHILIGAYSSTLTLLEDVGIRTEDVLLRTPLSLHTHEGHGLTLPDWPAPLDLIWGLVRARGWTWRDRMALIRWSVWCQRVGFQCAPRTTVAELTERLPATIRESFIEPICVSALNTPSHHASGRVFLRVLRDAMFGKRGSSHLLIPRVGLGKVFPEPARVWLEERGAAVHLAARVARLALDPGGRVLIDGHAYDHVVLAVAPTQAIQLLSQVTPSLAGADAAIVRDWMDCAAAIQFNAIATVYARCLDDHQALANALPSVMTALHPGPDGPAQFVFDRSRLGGAPGALSFVVSASRGDTASIESTVVSQARRQLKLTIAPELTVVEKRATFSCTPGLVRPASRVLSALSAAGDYCEGPYPATIEGAVRSGLAAGHRAAVGTE